MASSIFLWPGNITFSGSISSAGNISAGGQFLAANGTAAAPSYSFTSEPTKGMYSGGAGLLSFSAGSIEKLRVTDGYLWSLANTLVIGSTGNTTLNEDGPNILAQRNGTNAQTFNIYKTYTDASNYERLVFDTSSGGVARIFTSHLGTGVAHQLQFGVQGGTQWAINTSGFLITLATNTFDLGAETNTVKSGYFGTSLELGANGGTVVSRLSIQNTRRVNFVDQIIGKNLGGVDGADTYKTIYTRDNGSGYNGIEFRYGGDIVFYGNNGATTADAIVTPTELLRIVGLTGQVTASTSVVSPAYYTTAAAFMMRATTAWSTGAAAQLGTLTNAPVAGNPTKWIPVDDNGTTRYIPAW